MLSLVMGFVIISVTHNDSLLMMKASAHGSPCLPSARLLCDADRRLSLYDIVLGNCPDRFLAWSL